MAPKAAPAAATAAKASQAQTEWQDDNQDEAAQAAQNEHAAADSPYNAPNATVASIREAAEKTWAQQMYLYLV